MLFLLQKFNIFTVIIIILLSSTCKFLFAQSKVIYNWEKINYKIIDISIYNDEKIIVIDNKNKIRLIDTYSKKIKRFPGKFNKIFYDSKNIFAVSNEFKLYKLKRRIWKKIKISKSTNYENLTVFKDVIYGVKDGKIFSFNTKGKKINKNYFKEFTNINFIGFFDIENYITLTKNNELNFYYKNRILEKKANIKKILFINENYIIVSKQNGGLFILSLQDINENFKKINFKKKLNKIIISKSGKIWGSDDKSIYISSFTVDDLFLSSGTKSNDKEKIYSSKLTATKLFSGEDGIFKIDEYGALNYWNFKIKKFIPLYLKPLEISNPKKNVLWAINSLGRIFYYNGKKWKQIKGLAQSISSKNNLTIIVDENKIIKQYDVSKRKFLKTGIKAEKVFVKTNKNFWVMEKNKLSNCNFKGQKLSLKSVKCKKFKGKFQNLKITYGGRLFAITEKNNLQIFNGEKFVNYQTRIRSIKDIIGYKNNLIWLIDQNNNIFKNSNKKIRYKTSSHFETVKFVEQDLTGSGDVLLYGKKVSKNKYKSTASSANGGFTYKKNMKRKVVNNNVNFIDLSFGGDGRLWAVSNINEVFQYKDKTKSFKRYTRTNFSSKDQQYFGLPNNIDITRITSDNIGKIWIVKKDSKSIYYQDKLKGKYIETKLTRGAQNIKDLAIDASNNVYLAAGNIYKWDKSKKSFHTYINKNGPFLRVSSGPTGTLWAINNNGKLFELFGGKLLKRPSKGKLTANDVDISINGEVFVTSEVLKTTTTTREGRRTITNTQILKCDLYKYNPIKSTIEHAFDSKNIYSEIVTISREGSPWYTSPKCENKNVYYGVN